MITVFILVFVAMLNGDAYMAQDRFSTKEECLKVSAEISTMLEQSKKTDAMLYLGCVPVKAEDI